MAAKNIEGGWLPGKHPSALVCRNVGTIRMSEYPSYNTPFVLGRLPSSSGSFFTAILMALANPLKMASIL